MGGGFELIELTGWLGLILLSLCFAKLSRKQITGNQFMLFIRKNHKYFGWSALAVLFVHGIIASTFLIPVMGHGKRFAISEETGWGYLVWIILLAICITSVILPGKVFKHRHLPMVFILGALLLIHIE